MKKAIQTDLFGYPISDSCEADKNKKEAPANTPAIDERPARQIFLPSADEHLKLAANFRYYRLDEIQDHLDGFVDFAKKYRLYYIDVDDQEKCPEAIELILSKQSKRKQDLIDFAVIMHYYRNFHLFYEEMSEQEKNLLEAVADNYFLTEKKAEEIYGKSLRTTKRENYYNTANGLLPNLRLWFTTEYRMGYDSERPGYNAYNRAPYLKLQDFASFEIMKVLHPEYHAPKSWDALPAGNQLLTYQGEAAIHAILPIVKALFQTNQIKFGTSKCTGVAVKKVSSMTGVKEFFPNTSGDRIASFLLANIYGLDLTMIKARNFTTENDIKKLMDDMFQISDNLLPLILWNIKGFKKTELENCYGSYIIRNILNTLSLFAKGEKWLKAEDVCHKVRFYNWGPEIQCLWMLKYNFEKLSLYNTHNEHYIYADSIISQLTDPFIKGFLFMMAVFGIAEIAYDKEPAPDASCYYDTLKYVRLTPLGEYTLSMTTEYEKPKTQKEPDKFFEVYEDNLMVRMLKEDNPYASVLSNIGKSISKKLYKVSYDSFLNGCTCKKDITNRIRLFKEYICPEPPANWLQFFKDLEKRCNPMTEVKEDKYTLLQIPADDKELQRVILTDPEIRKYTLKAEGFILLVRTFYKDKVMKALQKHGYLV